jgi:hypothetical protein
LRSLLPSVKSYTYFGMGTLPHSDALNAVTLPSSR